MILLACKKEKPVTNPSVYDPNSTYTFTILDNNTNAPIDSAYVNFTYGNTFGDSKYSGPDGKVSFTIPTGWVVNEISINKANYCYYWSEPNSTTYPKNQTFHLDHYAYLRIHVQNLIPGAGEKVEIGHPTPYPPWYPYTPVIFVGVVDTTIVTTALAGNIGVTFSVFAAGVFDYSSTIFVTTAGGDTTDVSFSY